MHLRALSQLCTSTGSRERGDPMGWVPPAHWNETQAQLKKTQQVTLDVNGNGTLIFDPDNARQRWLVTSVIVSTNQAQNATVVPVVNIALNAVTFSTASPGNLLDGSWSGNQDTFTGEIDVGPCDFLSILFRPGNGATASQIATLSGVIATAVVHGVKYNRRS